MSKAIIQQSRQTYLVTDATKLTRSAPVRLASLAELDAIFTNRPLSSDLAQKCRDWDTAVHVSATG